MAASPRNIPNPGPHRLAILDDYANLAPPFFDALPVTIDSFPDTLHASNPEDLEALKKRLQPYTIISSLRERTAFPAALLEALPNLKLLLNAGNRNRSIDLEAAKRRGIRVTGTNGQAAPNGSVKPPPASHNTTAQQALSLLLSLASRIPFDNYQLQKNPKAWQSGFSVPLHGKKLGIVGLGKLGTILARMSVLALGMEVIAWSPNLTQQKADEVAEKEGFVAGTFNYVSKEELLRTSDVVSLHIVLSDSTRGLLTADDLRAMKPTAFLVNTSRAGLIQEEVLYDALAKGIIKGAALDVFWQEPLPLDSKWRTTAWGENGRSLVVMSPHMGYFNDQTMVRWYEEQADEVRKWLKGEEANFLMGY